MTVLADKLTEHRAGITAIDVALSRPRDDAVHLVVDAGRAAFVDTGTTHSLPTLLATLEAKGIDRKDVDWVLTTHVHLDHAGGAGALMRELPNARCAVHPRGARHLADPSQLIAGSRTVFGEERCTRLYGDILAVDPARLFVADDGAKITLGRRELELIHTPGHALHHYCIVDTANALIFSGDTFGLSYRDFDVDGRAFIFPTTTPVHFDPEALCRSVDRLMSYAPRSMFLTHYAEVTELGRLARELKERVLSFADLGARYRDAPDRASKLRRGMFAMIASWLDAHGYRRDENERHRLLDDDVELNCQGIEVWLDRK
jgi:glyoxylase-like metal-dependent hydrolase (beta-lactamase superfamily II)